MDIHVPLKHSKSISDVLGSKTGEGEGERGKKGTVSRK
jgi:hypothetical protein